MLGSNSADTAGNRIKATTKEQLFARFGQWSAQAKAAYDPDGSTDLATLVSRANDDFGQAEPARFAASAFAANGSPVYLYRFSYVQTGDAGNDSGRDTARRRNRLRLRHLGHRRLRPATPADSPGSGRSLGWRKATGSTSPRPAIRMVRACRLGRVTIPSKDLIFDFHPDGTAGAGPDPWKARLDVTQLATESGKRADF